jgi:hypothetical protein
MIHALKLAGGTMAASNSAIRFCIVNPDGGPLGVTLAATNTLQSGAKFNVIGPNKSVAERFELGTGAAGAAEHQLQTAPSLLDRGGLTWTILCCSIMAQVDKGIVEVTITQDGVRCPMTVEARYSFVDVPECDTPQDNAIEQRGSLMFLFSEAA